MEPTQQEKDFWIKDSNNWILRIFYFNKKDPRFVVDKPNPAMGITFNFAHKNSYVYLLIMSAFFGLLVYLISNSKHH